MDMFLNSSCTVMDRAKKAWTADLNVRSHMTEILPLAFQIEFNYITDVTINSSGISLSPYTCAYYLMFLCYHQLCQYENSYRALQQLIEVVNNPEQCGILRHYSYNIAGHCLLMTGENDRARDMFNRSIQFTRSLPYYERNNAAVWYIRNFFV